MPTECSTDWFGFARVEGRDVVAAFDGGAITSDAGEVCRIVGVRSRKSQMNAPSGGNAHRHARYLEGFGAEPTLRCRCDEMATDVESVVDRGM